jgi:hypothetical protein
LKGIPLELAQHKIKLDTTIPSTHHVRYRLNQNYVAAIKHDIDKFLAESFIQPLEEATWLSPIVVAPKKNGKLKIYVDFRKLNVTMKNDPFPLPFINEVLNIVARCEAIHF